MENGYANNPAEYLGCTDEEMYEEFIGISIPEIEQKLNAMFPGEDNVDFTWAVYHACNREKSRRSL